MGVSRPTVRQALNLLEQEGRLTRVKGSGTYVTEPKIQHESTRFVIGYQEESRERHNHLHTSVLALQKEKPGKLGRQSTGACRRGTRDPDGSAALAGRHV